MRRSGAVPPRAGILVPRLRISPGCGEILHAHFIDREKGGRLMIHRVLSDELFCFAKLEGFLAPSWRLCRLSHHRPTYWVSRLRSAKSFSNMHTRAESSQITGSMESLPSTARRKLEGRAFYESLGSPRLILAPMVDQSEFVRCFLPFLL